MGRSSDTAPDGAVPDDGGPDGATPWLAAILVLLGAGYVVLLVL